MEKNNFLIFFILIFISVGCVDEKQHGDDLNFLLFNSIDELQEPAITNWSFSNNTLYINWRDDENVLFTNLFLSKDVDDDFRLIQEYIKENKFQISNVYEGKTYYCFIISYGKYGEQSKPSEIIKIEL